ncbi:MAG: nitroreductase family protein [Clostridia bacterium]|nr:nitroreductase family protein [Clostridia bacterium]
MTNLQLYEVIFRRKSIRKYDMTPLPAAALAELRQFAGTVKPLDEKIRYAFTYLETDDVKNILPIKAPHYICLYSEKKGPYLMNAGFLLQQIDLYLSASGLGSCWLGMAKPSKQVPAQKDGLEYVIMIAFGNADEPIHRADPSEFHRNSLAAISQISEERLLEPARLAPSSSNTQPWFFSGNTQEITVSRKRLNLIKAPFYGRMNQIDIGIALCHLWLSLDHEGEGAVFDFQNAPAPDGYEFMAKVKAGSKETC